MELEPIEPFFEFLDLIIVSDHLVVVTLGLFHDLTYDQL